MSSPSVRLEGNLFRGRPSRSVRNAMETTRNRVLILTRGRSRVKTGKMRAGWYSNITGTGTGMQLAIANDVFYTKFQEFGTSTITPMLAATRSMRDATTFFQQELQKELKNDLGGRIEYMASAAIDVVGVLFGGSIQ